VYLTGGAFPAADTWLGDVFVGVNADGDNGPAHRGLGVMPATGDGGTRKADDESSN